MLERIHYVKGLGLLHDANGARFTLQKASLIYSDNGRGKSTLAALFRSCAMNNPALLTNRRTIDGTNDQEIRLQFSNGQFSVYQNGSWDYQRPELLVFDADFVEQNVYSGGVVSTDQRKNLLQFALGANAVSAQQAYNLADEHARNTTAAVRDIENSLKIIHVGQALESFQNIPAVPDADDQISALSEQIVDAENIGKIQAKQLPQELILTEVNFDTFFSTLNKSLENIDLAAETQVKTHLDNHAKQGLEKWVSDGHAYGEGENCLFCNQSLEGVGLIDAYRSYFNQDYKRLKTDVASLDEILAASFSDTIIDNLKASFDIAAAVIDGWQEHLELTPLTFNEVGARQALTELRTILNDLKLRKEANLLESIGSEVEKLEAQEKWQIIVGIVESTIQEIRERTELINAYKTNLAALDISFLRQQIQSLNVAKRRHEPAVVELFAQLASALVTDTAAQADKLAKKEALNQTMETTLATYKDSINILLQRFGAQFRISNIDYNYRGGLRSDYGLELRGGNIGLNGGAYGFRESLSEGDKRTLAFAFFVASAELDPDLSNKMVVIDDPMCSLDLNRKQQTITVLKRIHDNCQQLIVMAHDAHFLRKLRKEILRTGQLNKIKCLKLKAVANRYSDFDTINLDQECESAYYKSHRLLEEYMSGTAPSSMEVARSIRPLLEGYMHRRFPGLVPQGNTFGQVIIFINNSKAPSPLVHAQNITNELNEINAYAGQFHHDTNPAADQVTITDGELLTFVERAIELVHRGVV